MLTFIPHKVNEEYKKVEFYRINKELCLNEEYKNLSPTAILLYSVLCDRLSLTYSNKISRLKESYSDEEENVFIIFTRIDLERILHVGKACISSAFKQLKNKGLIKEKKQGRNKPNKIYVGKTISEQKGNFINWKSEKQTSGDTKNEYQEVRKSDTSKNNIINLKNKNKSFLNYEQRDYSNVDWSKYYANLYEN